MAEPIIVGRDLKVVYNPGQPNEYLALKVDHFEVYPQEYIILFGPSGCGKSTLLYCLLGVLPTTSGELLIKKENIYNYDTEQMVKFQQSTIGIIYQAFNLIPSISVLDNVCLPMIFANMSKTAREKTGLQFLRRFGVEAQARKLPTSLSGGQMQRIAVARSLVNDPEILLADEPVGNLDSVSTKQVMDTLQEVNEHDKKSIILVTHDAKHLPYAHRVYYLKDGRIEREVINPEKKQIKKIEKGKTILTEIEKLSRMYPYSTQEELRVKSMVNYLTQTLTFDQIARLEELIKQTIQGHITEDELIRSLGKPFDRGGVELSLERSKQFAEDVERIMNDAREIRRYRRRFEQKVVSEKQRERIAALCSELLSEFVSKMSIGQLQNAERAISQRISGLVTMEEFEALLKTSIEDGGLGFSILKARDFSRYFEKLIAQGTHI